MNANVNTLKSARSGISFTGALGKLVISFNVSGGIRSKEKRTNYSENENFYNDLNRFVISDANSDTHGNFFWGNTALSYEIDSLNLISGELQFWKGNFFSDTYSGNITNDIQNNLVQQYFITNETAYRYGGQSGNLDYQLTSKRNKEEIFTLSYKRDSYPLLRETDQRTDSIFQFYNEGLRIDNKSKSNENTFQLDYVLPFSEYFKAEFGSKYIMRRNSSISDEDTLNTFTDLYEENNDAYVDFSHTQDIIAGYVSFNGNIKKFGYKAGIRTEYAVTKGIFQTSSDTDFKNELIEYIPSCSFTYQFGKMNSIQIGYSKRIQRPGIWYLNPYVDDSNPKYVRYGNPDLISEHVHSTYWNAYFFTKAGSVSFGTYYDITGNGIGSVYFLRDEDVIHETYENTVHKTTYGLNFNANLTIFKKLNINANITTDYNNMQNENDASVKNTSWGSYSNLNLRYSFKRSFVLSGYGGFYSFPAGLQRTSYLFYYQGITLKKSFLKDKLSLTLTGNNLFWKNLSMSYDITDDYFHQSGRYTRPGRYVSIGISYKIGDMQSYVKKAKRGIQNTDVKSGGNNDTGGGN